MGLAPRIVDQIFVALRRLAAGGVSLLLVEQYVGRALEMADRIYVLNSGAISFSGSPAELDADELMRRYSGADIAGELAGDGNRAAGSGIESAQAL